MPTTRSDPPRSRVRLRAPAAWLVLALVVGLLSACSLLPDEEPVPARGAAATPDVVAGLERALQRRARAVRRGDPDAFRAGLVRNPALRRQQQTYFANLAQLPLARFRYTVDPASLVRAGDAYWVVVELRMQLDGFDDAPVASRDRYRFRAARGRPARFLLASVTDAAWEAEHEVAAQPWDLGPVEVRSGAGVLGVFDPGSVAASGEVLASVERGISAVSGVLPLAWSRTVVVYALSDVTFLAGLDDLPGGDPERLDGVTFPVDAGTGDQRLVSTRFVLHPRMLWRAGPERDRLVRHEVTHVAIGDRDDHAPVWLSEGVAEYVSVRPMAPQDRRVATDAVGAARAGFRVLPEDETFNGPDSAAHYALAWWACEYLASSFDELVLWTLLEELNDPDASPNEVLVQMLGLTEWQLARRAGRMLLASYSG